jgi:hypothetical protein
MNNNTNFGNLTNTKNTKRQSTIADELIKMKSSLPKIVNMDDEMTYLNKLDIAENNIFNIINHKKTILKNDNETRQRNVEASTTKIETLNKENMDLHKKLIELEKQHEYLQIEFNKCSEMKTKYITDITNLRRNNNKEFDFKMNNISKNDKNIKALKKELLLIINILKTRIVNIDTIDQDNKIKGYLVDIEKNTLKYLEMDRSEDGHKKAITFWAAMKDLLLGKD